jgi:hypothetical protein
MSAVRGPGIAEVQSVLKLSLNNGTDKRRYDTGFVVSAAETDRRGIG